MHLTYVIPYYAPAWAYGGPPRVTHDMARHLTKRGHHVQVMTTDAFDAARRLPEHQVTIDGVHVQRSRNLSNYAAWRYKIFLPVDFGRRFEHILCQTDLVHLFDFRSYQNAVALQLLTHRSSAPPYVLSAFGELPRASGVKRPIKQIFDRYFGFRLLRGAARVLAQTPQEADEYRRFGCQADQIVQLPLAVSLDEIQGPYIPRAFRQRIDILPESRVILFLGRIHEYKGLDLLIRAFSEVRKTRPDVRLVIAGRDDGYLSQARALAQQLAPDASVVFPGPIYGADRFSAYRDADIFAMTPTHAEQTSLAALEACAVGTPVVLTEQAPIPGLDAVGGGLTVEARSEAIAVAVARLLDSPQRSEMGQRAAMLVQRQHSWTAVTGLIESVYTEVIG